ncbi:MAG: FAD-dependent oxidoreductase [Dehalococcoidales bacterium]|jgi:NAD(P)H-nitrite reductase large subunit
MTVKKLEYLIIGNSAGAIGAAEAIREADTAGTLAIVSDEPYPAYSRPLISDYLAHPGPIDRMLYRKPDFYEKNGARAILGDKALKINPDARTAALASGLMLTWEHLLLATGGTPIVPNTEGIDLKNVFTFNRLDDAKAIDAAFNPHRRLKAVVIGGGLIGVSVTEALMKRGMDVVIVEMKDRILNTILDEEASAMETTALLLAGVTIITGHTVTRINSNLRGEVSGVTLDDGRLIHCEMVIAAIGVRPRLDLVTGTGIKTGRGITVDRHMETSEKDIYACGDVAEAFDFVTGNNRLTPIWPNAYEGGRVAGLNMAGQPTEYKGGTAMNALKYFGVNVVSAGLVVSPDNSYETLINRRDGIYRKVILKNGKLAGLIYAGDIEKSGIVYNLMKDGADVSAFKQALVADDFGLASLPESLWRSKLARPAAAEKPAAAVTGH